MIKRVKRDYGQALIFSQALGAYSQAWQPVVLSQGGLKITSQKS